MNVYSCKKFFIIIFLILVRTNHSFGKIIVFISLQYITIKRTINFSLIILNYTLFVFSTVLRISKRRCLVFAQYFKLKMKELTFDDIIKCNYSRRIRTFFKIGKALVTTSCKLWINWDSS